MSILGFLWEGKLIIRHMLESTPVVILESGMMISIFGQDASPHTVVGCLALAHVVVILGRNAYAVIDVVAAQRELLRSGKLSQCRSLRERAELLAERL